MKKTKKKGLENLKSRYGLMFISPWIIGLLLFFLFRIMLRFIETFILLN